MASDQEMAAVPQSDLPQQQLRLVAYGSSRTARRGSEWFPNESDSAAGKSEASALSPCGPAPPNLLYAAVRIVQAPASFARPVTQKKSFRPAFKVRLDFRYKGKLQLPVKVEAVSLPEHIVDDIIKQQAEDILALAQLSQQNELENASISTCIQTHEEDPDDLLEKTHSEDLEFSELRFSKSSRMNKRWVLFACRLGRDMLYSLYRLPTIVLSRKADQFDKACGLLRESSLLGSLTCGSDYLVEPQALLSSYATNRHQEVVAVQQLRGFVSDSSLPAHPCHRRLHSEPPKSMLISRETVEQYIVEKYAASGLRRPLMEAEVEALGTQAGLPSFIDCPIGMVDALDLQAWRGFQDWFCGCMKALKPVDHLWSMTDVIRICPFTVNRKCAEHLLQGTPDGTFLVRMCSYDVGSFVISIQCVHHSRAGVPTREVKHVLIDRVDLKDQSLEAWVMRNERAQYLLDIQSRDYVHKSAAFTTQTLGSANSSSEFIGLYPTQPLLSPSPPLSTTTNIDPGTPTLSVDHTLSEETGNGISIALPQHLLPQPHFCQHQLPNIPPQGMSMPPQEEYLSQDLQRLIDMSGLTCQQLSLLKSDSMAERMVKKRASSSSIDTTVFVGDRPCKKRISGGGNSASNAVPGVFLNMPSFAFTQRASYMDNAGYSI